MGQTTEWRIAVPRAQLEVAIPIAVGESLSLRNAPPGCSLKATGETARITLRPPPGEEDDEIALELVDAQDVPQVKVIIRRTRCRVSAALIERGTHSKPLWPETIAALLWYGWGRYEELVGIKRFTSGLGGSDVLVFRPRLREPDVSKPSVAGRSVLGVVAKAWGSALLVKTGKVGSMEEEWDRFNTFLRDRQHPFMARSEALLTVEGTEVSPSEERRATVIGQFLGGELLRVESLESIVRGSADSGRSLRVINQLFEVNRPWYAGGELFELGCWTKMLRKAADGRLMLCGNFDLTREGDLLDENGKPKERGRSHFKNAVGWDVGFVKREHLHRHLLGKNDEPGLLDAIQKVRVRFSLIHGDLHPRNVLADEHDTWLLDFGGVGVMPTLFEFAKLEVYLRLWCVDLNQGQLDSEAPATEFESLLLDHFTGSENSTERIRDLAPKLGADRRDLLKLAQCVTEVRRQALRYCDESPDRRDYLSVLFLTLLNTLQFANTGTAPVANFRLLVSLFWVVEDALCGVLGLPPFDRQRTAMHPAALLTRDWLAADGAAQRVAYLMNREDGRHALSALAATRGVIQSGAHHLDVYDHTLLVVAYLEDILRNPLDALADPCGLDGRVEAAVRGQGISVPPPFKCPNGLVQRFLQPRVMEQLRANLEKTLTTDARLLLKWVALLHDVGKGATRCLERQPKHSTEKVRFFGHEKYGWRIAEPLFARLCNSGDELARARHVIVTHHDHHNLVKSYLDDAARFQRLCDAVHRVPLDLKSFGTLRGYFDNGIDRDARPDDFPLMILHGFADSAACRGPESNSSLDDVARVDLLLLAAWAVATDHFNVSLKCKPILEVIDEAVGGLGIKEETLGRIRSVAHAWCLKENTERLADGRALVDEAESKAKVKEIAIAMRDGGQGKV